MKIEFLNTSYTHNNPKCHPYNFGYNQRQPINLPIKDTVSFGQAVPQSVIKYLKSKKIELYSLGLDKYFLQLFDAKQLEGIQNGIEIFNGLSFSQIAYMVNNLTGIILQRGCTNNCIHCFAEAKPPYFMKKNNFIEKIDFEDYEKLCNGFKELNKRLGFNVFSNGCKSLFYDSDCSMIYMQDKSGKIYDYADLAKMFHEAAKQRILFDTAGWNKNDTKTQKRMEDLVKKIANSNEYDFLQFNISVNPFHSIYSKSLDLKAQGKTKEAKRLEEIFTDRIANVIFTSSPLIDKTNSYTNKSMLGFIFRGLFDFTDLDGYHAHDVICMFNDIVEKVEKLYTEDLLSGRHKVIKSQEQLDKYYYFLNGRVHSRIELINMTNERLINKLGDIDAGEWNILRQYSFNSVKEGIKFTDGFIDVNGRFYMTNYMETYPTDIVINYKTKGMPTAPIAPNLRDGTITKELIEKYYG